MGVFLLVCLTVFKGIVKLLAGLTISKDFSTLVLPKNSKETHMDSMHFLLMLELDPDQLEDGVADPAQAAAGWAMSIVQRVDRKVAATAAKP